MSLHLLNYFDHFCWTDQNKTPLRAVNHRDWPLHLVTKYLIPPILLMLNFTKSHNWVPYLYLEDGVLRHTDILDHIMKSIQFPISVFSLNTKMAFVLQSWRFHATLLLLSLMLCPPTGFAVMTMLCLSYKISRILYYTMDSLKPST